MGDRYERGAAFCPRCEAERPVTRTVPWQPDICTVCGADVPDGE